MPPFVPPTSSKAESFFAWGIKIRHKNLSAKPISEVAALILTRWRPACFYPFALLSVLCGRCLVNAPYAT